MLLRGEGDVAFVSGRRHLGVRTRSHRCRGVPELRGADGARLRGACRGSRSPWSRASTASAWAAASPSLSPPTSDTAADDARFAIPAARLGLGYGEGGLRTLERLVGPSSAKEILFTARRFDAPEARHVGLVNAVLPKRRARGHVREAGAGDRGQRSAHARSGEASAGRDRARRREPATTARWTRRSALLRERGLPRGRSRLPREATPAVPWSIETGSPRRLRPGFQAKAP